MSGVAVLGITSCTKPTYQQPDAPIQEVPFTQVHINDGFWLPRIETTVRFLFLPLLRNVKRMDVLIISPLQAD